MKLPKTRNAYCPKCKVHTEHKISEAKRKTMGSAHPMSHGNRAKNRHKAVYGNAGRYSRPAGGKMYGKKQSKKVDLRFECSKCHRINVFGRAWRAKRVEFA